MRAKKPASLSASLIARNVAVVPGGPRSAVTEIEPIKPASLSESTIAGKAAVVPDGDRPQPQPRERKSLSLPDWRISTAIAVLFAAGVVTAVWQQTAGERRPASEAVHATDIPTVAETAEPPSDSADRATSAGATGRPEPAIPAPAKAPPRQTPEAPPGESFAAAPSALPELPPPPVLNVSAAAMPTDAPPPAEGVESGAVKGEPDSQSKPEPAAGKDATPRPRSKPVAKPAYVIQLSAVKTVAGARRETRRLQRSLGRLLKGRQLQVQKSVTRGRGTVYRVHLIGFPNRVGARSLCARIKARAFNCLVKKR